jgi:hypothetical protein
VGIDGDGEGAGMLCAVTPPDNIKAAASTLCRKRCRFILPPRIVADRAVIARITQE